MAPVCEGLDSWTASQQPMLLGIALPKAEELRGEIRRAPWWRAEIAESWRSGCEMIGDVDPPLCC